MILRLVCLIAVVWLVEAGVDKAGKVTVDRVRGIPLSRKPFYDPNKEFKCLDGSKSIAFEYVNDDYCDCADGSDEPGTAACPNGHFHCVNLGHRPMNIPSSRVNDQICDCCDGSDEWGQLVSCPNTCDELGRESREAAEKQIQKIREGFEKRKDLVKQAQEMLESKQKRLEELQKEREALDPQKNELDMAKQMAEKAENEAKDKHTEAWRELKEAKKEEVAQRVFDEIDANQDKKLTPTELMVLPEFDKNKDGAVTEEEAKEHLADADESDFEHFYANVWDKIRHVYQLKPSGDEPVLPTPTPSPKSTKPPTYNEDGEEEEDEEEIQGDAVEDFADPNDYEDRDSDSKTEQRYQDLLSSFQMSNQKKTVASAKVDDVPMPPYDEATQALINAADEARRAFNDFDVRYKEVDDELKKLEEFAKTDFGEDNVWAALKGQCHAYHDQQYTYKVCLFDNATQLPKTGGMETSIGRWGEWSGDEASGEDKYARMKYTGGQSCWNGPDRSVEIFITCGSEIKLLSASEPGKCEYRIDMESPAACMDPELLTKSGSHVEL